MIVPTLNEAERLPRLLARLGRSGGVAPGDALGDALKIGDALGASDELIIVDGGSRDATLELARGAAGVQVLELGSACRGAQLAHGAERANAELLLFLHADCLPGAGALDRLRTAFEDPLVVATSEATRISMTW